MHHLLLTPTSQSVSIDWGNVAEWFGGIATAAAVVVALWVASRDSRRIRRAEEVDQAKKIAVWRDPGNSQKVIIQNATALPIFDVLISWGVAYGAGEAFSKGTDSQTFVLMVPPGSFLAASPRSGGGGMHIQLGLSISFRDANGKFWRRDATGKLQETARGPLNENEVDLPVGNWTDITPAA